MSLAALAKSRLFAHACGRVEGNVLGIEMCKLVLSLVASFIMAILYVNIDCVYWVL